MTVEMHKGRKMGCRRGIISYRRSLGTGVVAVMLNPSTTAAIHSQYRDRRLRPRCLTGRGKYAEMLVPLAMGILDRVDQYSKIDIMISDTLRNPTMCEDQQLTASHFLPMVHNNKTRFQPRVKPRLGA